MPLDINDFRPWKGGDIEKIKESQKRRFKPEEEIDEIVKLDEAWRKKRGDLDLMNKEKRKLQDISKQAYKKHKNPKNFPEDVRKQVQEAQNKTGELAKTIKAEKAAMEELAVTVDKLVRKVGNYVHDDIPVSKNEDDNGKVKVWGKRRMNPDKTLRHHHELLWMIGGYEPERGTKVASHRGYFLTGPAVRLNLALQMYGLDFLKKYEYKEVYPPFFMKKDVMEKTAQLEEFDEALYHVKGGAENEDSDKYLIATSEQPISAMHMNDWLKEKDLPIKYAGVSTCFRKEAGSAGKDCWGIFRVHQFEKIEQFVICSPEVSWDMHEEMIGIAEEFYKSLNIPYEVVNIVTGELNNAAAKKYDLEGWFPTLERYRELVSCSNCTDYQSRAMETRYGEASSKDEQYSIKQYVHMLNATLCATTRTICCILENYQRDDGVDVPQVLQPYMGGVKFLPYIRPPRQVSETHSKKVKNKPKGGKKKKSGGKC